MNTSTILANNVIASFENEDPNLLVESVYDLLSYKAIEKINTIKNNLAESIFDEPVQSDTFEDSYPKYQKHIKEAIDNVVEACSTEEINDEEINEKVGKEIEKYKTDEEVYNHLKEYFKVTSAVETGNEDNDNVDRMNDQDSNKRVQYEQYVRSLKNGGNIELSSGKNYRITKHEGFILNEAFNMLDTEHQIQFVNTLTNDKINLLNVLSFSAKAVKNGK
jgi:hypothetical protein